MQQLAGFLGIDEVDCWKNTGRKTTGEDLTLQEPPLVGDGINDAPCTGQSQWSVFLWATLHRLPCKPLMQLMNRGLQHLPLSLGLGIPSYHQTKSFYFYNIVAISIAAFGFIDTYFAALVMGLSDVVLAVNSIRFVKRVVWRAGVTWDVSRIGMRQLAVNTFNSSVLINISNFCWILTHW